MGRPIEAQPDTATEDAYTCARTYRALEMRLVGAQMMAAEAGEALTARAAEEALATGQREAARLDGYHERMVAMAGAAATVLGHRRVGLIRTQTATADAPTDPGRRERYARAVERSITGGSR